MSTVWVCGSANSDLVATVGRLPHRGETLLGEEFKALPGGKGLNQAVAAARYGVHCVFIACVGADPFGDTLIRFLCSEGIDVKRVRRTAQFSTGCALVTVAKNDNTIVVVAGANDDLRSEDLSSTEFGPDDALVAQLEVPIGVTAEFFRRGRLRRARTILNFAPASDQGRELLEMAEVVVLNETELAFLSRIDAADLCDLEKVQSAIRKVQVSDDQWFVLTRGARGCIAHWRSQLYEIPGRVVEAIDTVGAGDCFVGVLAAQIIRGAAMVEALEVANLAASVSVQRSGAAFGMPYITEVMPLLDQSADQP